MEIKEYLKIFRKSAVIILLCVIFVTLGAYVFTVRQKVVFEGNGSLTIIPKPATTTKSNFYEYDGYYALQASGLLGNSITAWLQSPDVVFEIYKQAGIDTTGLSAKQLVKSMKAEMLVGTFAVKFQIKNSDRNRAESLAKSTISVIQNKTAEFNQKAGTKINFELQADPPVITELKPKKELELIAGALAGLILGIFLSFVLEYFKKS